METQDGVELCFPHLLNSSCRKPRFHWSETVFVNTVLSFISLITAALNLLVILSVSHFRQLHTPTNILLLSLAVSDFLVGLLSMPAELFRRYSCWVLGDTLCSVYIYVASIIVSSSIGNIVLISIDRYVAICDPLHYPTKISVSKAKVCVCLCWIISAFYRILFVKDELIQPGRSNSCTGECAFSTNSIAGFFDIILNLIAPVSVIVVLYMRVFMVAVSQARAMRSHITAVTVQLSKDITKKSELKAARTLGVLVIVFLISYCPYYCYSLVQVNVTSTSYASFLFFLFYFNSCLNPLIYALFYPWFRKAIKHIVSLQILQPGSCEANIL
ncbi:trace amine-associated receptor 13c-like [Kryptolebias marmoratus]|uniref:trace amine-associated receptor 13c-like n=1 Tax=Kryptolebias marmoratus TaxID=37003 RepID=UPI0007F88D7A|nr:trace amine-associated receptor 13c-like [Kryptolebias marmoratus]